MWQLALHVNTATVVLGLFAALAFAFLFAAVGRRWPKVAEITAWAAGSALALFILYITIRPQGGWGMLGQGADVVSLTPAAFLDDAAQPHSLAWQELILNAAMMLPLGILAPTALTNPFARWGFGFVLSLSIETLQWGLSTGRSADVMDVVGNTAGYVIGVLLTLTVSALLAGTRDARARQSVPAAR